MAVLSKISVGDIFYYLIDDVPTHSAPKGSVSVLSNDSAPFIYRNNDGGSVWVKNIKPSYGEMFISDSTTEFAWDDYTLGAFYSFNNVGGAYTSNVLNGFEKGTDAAFGDFLRYTGDPRVRAVVKTRTTTRGGIGRWLEFEHTSAYNFDVSDESVSGFYTLAGGIGGTSCVHIQNIDKGGEMSIGFSPISRQNAGGPNQRTFINKHAQLGVYKIDEAKEVVEFVEDWESSGFTENNWSIVNDTTNVWVVGQAENNTPGGTSSAYVSDDGGTSASYTITTANVSHFYKDFVIPDLGDVQLMFDWKCQGENTAGNAVQYDYGTVVITDTGTTPVAGTEVTTTRTPGAATTRLSNTADNDGKFNLGYGTNPGTEWNTEVVDLTAYAGQTKRIVFTWINDGSVGSDPPFVLDNIELSAFAWG